MLNNKESCSCDAAIASSYDAVNIDLELKEIHHPSKLTPPQTHFFQSLGEPYFQSPEMLKPLLAINWLTPLLPWQ